ncbi:putative mitochondrial outer membrane protein [Xylaria sp. CBS 124048]|nr:putative mitochondrial outer membrane protein [Xylaria sp. CBS 124048]
MPSTLQGSNTNSRAPEHSGWFTIPTVLARLFKRFPLLTYPPNELPIRSPDIRDVPTLYVFISDEDALQGLPSFNPACLKWQTFLKLAGVDFRLRPSNNHASPTGALPFLLPPSAPNDARSQIPVPSNKLEQYGLKNGKSKLPGHLDPRLEAYESLLNHRIRDAWLYTLYLSPANTNLLTSLYIAPATSSRPVRATLLYQLRHAAELGILRSTGKHVIDPGALYNGVKEAFGALEALLGVDIWFFGSETPGLFDATVFSYTHLILHESLAWENRRLNEILQDFPRLIDHRERIFQKCWGFNT